MILPGSYTTALILLIAGMLGWGLWANFFKASGKQWRFELFYFDFAIGVLLASLFAAFTFGSLGFDGFSFRDDLQLAGKRQDVFGLAAGVIFNLGNMLLLAGVSLTGMTLAFPAGLGCALIVSAIWSSVLTPGGSVPLRLAGIAAIIVAIVLDVLAYRIWADLRFKSQTENNPGGKPRRRRSAGKGLALSLAGGVMLGSFGPLLDMGSASDIGLGPYSLGFVFSIGVAFSTFVFNLFFMNLPVQGKPVDIGEYFRGTMQKHALGFFGGLAWYAGLIAILLRARFETTVRVGTQTSFALQQSAMIIAALCGLLLWKEYDGSDSSVRLRLGLMFVLLAVGIGAMTAGVAVTR